MRYSLIAGGILALAAKRVRHQLPDVKASVRLIETWPAPPSEIEKTAFGLAFAKVSGRAGRACRPEDERE
jgi:hypothetical protein